MLKYSDVSDVGYARKPCSSDGHYIFTSSRVISTRPALVGGVIVDGNARDVETQSTLEEVSNATIK